MRKPIVLVLSLMLFPLVASAQSAGAPPPPPDDAQDVDMARPPGAEPDAQPPPPPSIPPEPPQASPDDQVGILQGDSAPAYAQPQAAPAPAGQWVFTAQYGWVFMPYGQQYVDAGAYQYVFSVRVGWSWVSAPWLWGSGASPWFGRLGPSHFVWYRRPYRSGYVWGGYRGSSVRVVHDRGGYSRGVPARPLGAVRGGGAGRGYGGARGGSVPHAVAPVRQRSRG